MSRKNAFIVPGGFSILPRKLMRSENFSKLSKSSVVVLVWLIYQFRGRNNGDLSATSAMARKWGIASDQTLNKALKQLVELGFIERSREPVFLKPGGKCSLYSLTWLPIDECGGKLDVKPTNLPSRPLSFWTQKKTLRNL